MGAAAKAMTVINAAAIQPDYFFDEAELKVGKFPPGMNVKYTRLLMIYTINSSISRAEEINSIMRAKKYCLNRDG